MCKAGRIGSGCRRSMQAVRRLWSTNPLNRNIYVTIYPMIYQVKELLLPDGKSPYADWFGTLDAMVAAKVSVGGARSGSRKTLIRQLPCGKTTSGASRKY